MAVLAARRAPPPRRRGDAPERAAASSVPTSSSRAPRIGPSLAHPETVAVTGRVTATDGQPIAGARVTFTRHDGRPRESVDAVTGSDGRYVVDLQLGDHDALATAHGHANGDADTRVQRGATVPVDFVLPPGVTLHGRVVRGDQGPPCADAAVEIDDAPGFMTTARAVTDASGRFTVDGVRFGIVEIAATGPGCATDGDAHVELPFDEPPPDEIVVVAARAFAVEGRLVADDDPTRGIAGTRVAIGDSLFDGLAIAKTTSDASGRFRIEGVLPGDYLLHAAGADGHVRPEPLDVTVGGDLVGLVVPMRPGRTIRGRVEPADVARITVKSDEPDADLQVKQRLRDLRRTTDAGGSFELTGVPDGALRVLAQTIDGKGGAIELAVTEDRDGVVIAIAPPGDRMVHGRVVDEQGMPVASTRVTVSWEGEAAPGGASWRDAVTSPDGAFTFDGVPRRSGRLRVDGRVPVDASAFDLDLRAGDASGTFVVASQDHVIAGRVILPDGQPARGATVAVRGPEDDAARVVETARDGRFEITGLRAREFLLFAATADQRAAVELAGVVPGRDRRVRLEPRGDLVVRLTDGGRPVRSYEVWWTVDESTTSTHVDRGDGVYRVSGVAPGRIACTTSSDGGIARGTVELAGQTTLELAVSIRWGAVRGSVVDGAGRPLADADVACTTEVTAPGPGADVATTDAAGRFACERVVPGSGEVTVGDATRAYTVGSGATEDVGTLVVTALDLDPDEE